VDAFRKCTWGQSGPHQHGQGMGPARGSAMDETARAGPCRPHPGQVRGTKLAVYRAGFADPGLATAKNSPGSRSAPRTPGQSAGRGISRSKRRNKRRESPPAAVPTPVLKPRHVAGNLDHIACGNAGGLFQLKTAGASESEDGCPRSGRTAGLPPTIGVEKTGPDPAQAGLRDPVPGARKPSSARSLQRLESHPRAARVIGRQRRRNKGLERTHQRAE